MNKREQESANMLEHYIMSEIIHIDWGLEVDEKDQHDVSPLKNLLEIVSSDIRAFIESSTERLAQIAVFSVINFDKQVSLYLTELGNEFECPRLKLCLQTIITHIKKIISYLWHLIVKRVDIKDWSIRGDFASGAPGLLGDNLQWKLNFTSTCTND
jgi:hypothetical protein